MRLKFKGRTPFAPTRGQPYDRRAFKRTAREPHTSLQLVTLYTPFRVRLLEEIRREPGISYRALARRVGRDETRVHDNVRRLVEARLVVRVKEPGRVSLYPNGVKPTLRVRAQSVITERVTAYLARYGEATMRDLTRELGISRHQAGRALGALERAGRITVLRRATIARLKEGR